MKVFSYVLASVLLASLVTDGNVSEINRYKKSAEDAFLASEYGRAAVMYQRAIASGGFEPAVFLNYAHCAYRVDNLDRAKAFYHAVAQDQQAETDFISAYTLANTFDVSVLQQSVLDGFLQDLEDKQINAEELSEDETETLMAERLRSELSSLGINMPTGASLEDMEAIFEAQAATDTLTEDKRQALKEAFPSFKPAAALKSVAHDQLALIAAKEGGLEKLKEALAHSKKALRYDPSNETARHNYEMIKKLHDQAQQQQQNQKDQNKDQQKQQDEQEQGDQNKQQQQNQNQQEQNQQEKKEQQKDGAEQNQEEQQQSDQQQEGEKKESQEQDGQQGKEEQQQEGKENGEEKKEKEDGKPEPGKEKDGKPSEEELKKMQLERFKQMNISPERAKALLKALQREEKQYYQQMQRKPKKAKDPDKPDW